MSFTGDYGEQRSEPWTYRKRVIPLRTYSGKVVHRRKKHLFSPRDAARIIEKLEPPEEEADGWAVAVMRALRQATIAMLEKILFFLDSESVEQIYDFGIQLLDILFRVEEGREERRDRIRLAIIHLAEMEGFEIKFKE